MRWHVLPVGALMVAAVLFYDPAAEAGFHRAKAGDVIENMELAALSGGTVPLLGEAAVNVFVFFRPNQEHSHATLAQLAKCEKVFAGKSVRWVAVTSDRFAPADIEAEVKTSGISFPVVIDHGDELYGRLGVALCPTIGILDKQHRLVADLSFTKVNYPTIINGYIRRQLGEISDAQLRATLDPPPAVQGGDAEVARRRLKYASKLLEVGRHAKALESVQASLEKDPELVAAFVLQGQILAAQDRRNEARKSFDKALELDPSNDAARSGRQALADRHEGH